jgi:recombination protein RecT
MNSLTTWQGVVASVESDFTRIAVAGGNAVTFAKESQYALQIIMGSDYLQKCSTDTIRNAIINVAAAGLTLNPAMKLAYLIPRKGKCVLDISYLGLLKIATDSGSILAAKAEIVRANDRYVPKGPFEAPIHQYSPFDKDADRGEIIGVYVVAKLAAGGVMVDTMNKEEIDKVRAVSEARNGPWANWYGEMAKKTAIKRASKSWPRTERLSQAEAILNEHEGFGEIDITPDDDAPAISRAKPPRQNATAIATAALAAPDSEEKASFLQELEAKVRAQGTAFYEPAYRAMSRQQRQWLGKEGHEAMWALACDIDTQLA